MAGSLGIQTIPVCPAVIRGRSGGAGFLLGVRPLAGKRDIRDRVSASDGQGVTAGAVHVCRAAIYDRGGNAGDCRAGARKEQ